MYAIIRIRGTLNIKPDTKKTLNLLRLNKPNHCVVVPENDIYKGMIKKAKDYITWGEINQKTLEKLIKNRGKISQKKKIPEKDVKQILKKISDGKIKETGIKPVFQLSPPKKGFERKGVKKTFTQKGALGYRGDKINALLERMI